MYENGTAPQVFTNDNSAGWLLPWLLFGGANGANRFSGNYSHGADAAGYGQTLSSELGKAGNEALRDAIHNLGARIDSDKSAAETTAIISEISGLEKQICSMITNGQLSDCAKHSELISTINQCCCRTQDAICGLKTDVMMGHQNILSTMSVNALRSQYETNMGFKDTAVAIAGVQTNLSHQLCDAVCKINTNVRDENEKTRAMLHDAEVQGLRDKLAQCSNDAQTAKIEALILSSCGDRGRSHHGGCCSSNNNGPGNS